MDALSRLTTLTPYLALAFGLLASVLSLRSWRKRVEEHRAALLYFLSFFVLLGILPVLIILFQGNRPLEFLGAAGLRAGNVRLGLLLVAVSSPFAALSTLVSRRDPAMIRHYPFSKAACSGAKKLAAYEAAYLVFYYLPWEFAFRGLLFFPLVGALGLVPALAVQTMLSTLYHLGHPDTEILAAVGSGFVFGLVAFHTQSIFYAAAIHGLCGVLTDTTLCRRHRPVAS
ncbi:MAG: CPBP family intramembrane metalloprotease [Candidatus Aminicenantes bacterium]|nr:CPBP family intramembrane metalloprotease [Candidatus Aminicenantes bacterium]